MALVFADRVQENSTTTGTGTYTLSGATTGYQAWSVVGNANTAYYMATDGIGWEVGLGTYTLSGTTLARTTILSSSNANAAVSWAAGTRTISQVDPASWLSGLAPLSSPALTGSPTAPTQTANDNSTKLATTAYVDSKASGQPIPSSTTFAIGTFMLLGVGASSVNAGSTIAGSNLRMYQNNSGTLIMTANAVTGTWMNLSSVNLGTSSPNGGYFVRTV